jgi:DNA polymerase-4
MTLNEDTSSRALLDRHLSLLVEKAAHQLQCEKLTCATVSLRLRYSDFVTTSRANRINRTANDREIYQTCLRLLCSLLQSRAKVRMIGVHLGSLQPGAHTPDLFESLKPEHQKNLPDILKIIRAKYGFGAILRSSSTAAGNK